MQTEKSYDGPGKWLTVSDIVNQAIEYVSIQIVVGKNYIKQTPMVLHS